MTRLAAVLGLLAAPMVLVAQRVPDRELEPTHHRFDRDAARCAAARSEGSRPLCVDGRRSLAAALPSQDAAQPASFWSVIASAAVPGSGQMMLRVERFLPYLAFEAYTWTQYAAHSREYRRHRNAYQELSSRVARSPFTIVFPRGDFEYYERMQHFRESGRFEVMVGGVLDPEPDTTTFNGSVWLLARRTYWSDADVMPDTGTREWKQAVDFYIRRAYDQPYRWSWTRAPLEFDEFRRLIRRSNDSNRKSVQDLGAIIANHMLSAVDAYVTVRLRRRPEQGTGGEAWELGGTLPMATISRVFAR
jgi:hypothetical protein